MKGGAHFLAVVVLLAALPAQVVQAQTISGKVATTIGVPIQGVTVSATRTSPFQRVTDVTDGSGDYSIGGRLGELDGTYTVQASATGYTFTPASTNVTLGRFGDAAIVNFTAPSTSPTVETLYASNVLATSALLVGRIRPNGQTTRTWWEYGLTTTYGTIHGPVNFSGNTFITLSTGLGGLSNGTTYHFRLAGSNSFGIVFGEDRTFTTPSGVPLITTLPPTDGSASGMRLNGFVAANGSTNVSVWFDMGTTTNYGFPAFVQSFGATNRSFNQPLASLTPGTYHHRAVAASAFGTNYGADLSFTPGFSDIAAGLPGVAFSAVAWGDYDNDGLLDILLTGTTNGTAAGAISQVWRNTGTGFTNIDAGLPGVTGSNNGNGSVAWGDYDNDGRLDVLLTGLSTSNNAISQVWRNMGSGFVRDTNVVLPGVYDGSVAWGDYDNDGRLDILLAGRTSGGNIAQVWRNAGTGFVNITAGLPGVFMSAAAWGDYDNDGWLDIALTGLSGSAPICQVWRNTGSGFTNINAGVRGVYAGAVAWGDYDNDGRLDLLLEGANFNFDPPRFAQVWRNTATGFMNINADLEDLADGSAAWGDYDNDGWLDILITGAFNASPDGAITQIHRNNRNGTFTAINPGVPGAFRSSSYLGDFDADGRLDFLLTGYSAAGFIARVWRNGLPAIDSPPAAPSGLNLTVTGTIATLAWNASVDNETPTAGLTYNLRIGTTRGGSDMISPMSGANGLRRLPQLGNAQQGSTASFRFQAGTSYYWSVQAVDNAFAGSPFSSESSFKLLPVVVPVTATNAIPGDLDGNGVVDTNELNNVLANYWANNPWLQMTNPAKLDEGFFQFALTNEAVWNFGVEVTTNLTDWSFLGPAFPVYQFVDPDSTNQPQRYYRLRWP